MTQSERFQAVFRREKPDRLPVFFFGCWAETEERWKREGMTDMHAIPGMDPDWEDGLWDCHGMALIRPLGDMPRAVVEETGDYMVYHSELGEIVQSSKQGSSVSHVIKHALEPTHASWARFKTFLNAGDPRRRDARWQDKADALNKADRVRAFMGGSLYGWLRDWMGVEQISYLMYDDPALLEEMVAYLTDYYMAVFAPVLRETSFDFVYIFEDCCGKNGPLFSPAFYKRVLEPNYKRLIRFYKDNGVPLALIDSDGDAHKLIPLWLASGFDIVFPVEVGAWNASPGALRGKFGRGLNMFGGVDKHVIPLGEEAVRRHLLALKPTVEEGGYLPIPDHRMPPSCAYEDFLTYIRVFNEVFNDDR